MGQAITGAAIAGVPGTHTGCPRDNRQQTRGDNMALSIAVVGPAHAEPAELAGLGALQSFLERGYAAFRVMRGGSEFVEIVAGRERAISEATFAGRDEMLRADRSAAPP